VFGFAEPGGTLGFVLGVFGGNGLSLGFVGTSGAGGIEGEVGGGGVFWVQPAMAAVRTAAATIALGFIFLSFQVRLGRNACG
jgi:hypothetical protein